ncbi:equilibrative nucleobase transporter 1-like [Diadema antillarum]|uniref:equilibrative nucleobase transporter 1-like n=1 Tax=Diadema antillarum TaxID=105358 RepID=UPI003A8ADB85
MARLRSKIEKTITLILSILENAFNAGIFYGWPSLVFILKQQGFFLEGCNENGHHPDVVSVNGSLTSYNSSAVPQYTELVTVTQYAPQDDGREGAAPCPYQDSRFQLVFTVAAFCMQGSVFPSGLLFDKLGTRFVRILFSILLLAGYLFLAFSTPARATFLFPAGILIGIGGILMMVCSMQVSNLFGPNKATIMTLMSGCFDSSAVVMLIVKLSYEAGLPMSTAFFVMAGGTLFFNINTFILLSKRVPWPLPPGYTQVQCCGGQQKEKDEVANQEELDMKLAHKNGTLAEKEHLNGGGAHRKGSQRKSSEAQPNGMKRRKSRVIQAEAEAFKKQDFPTIRSCLCSLMFWLLVAWISILQLRLIFMIGTLNPWLNQLSNNDKDVVSHYTNIFSIIQFCGFVVAPLGGLLLDRNKMTRGWCVKKNVDKRSPYADLQDAIMPLSLTTILFTVFSVCIVIPKLELQYLTFLIQVVIRSFLYGLSVAVIPIMFPQEFFGTLFGVMGSFAGIFGLLQYPIFSILQNVLHGDPFILNICFIVFNLLTLSLPIYIFIFARRKERNLKEVREEGPHVEASFVAMSMKT